MKALKGTVEVTVQLTKANCYYMNHGVCSLSLIDDFFFNPDEHLMQNDLFYCPHLLKEMTGDEATRKIAVIPCDCGHVQVLSGHQCACIAERKALVLPIRVDEEKGEKACCAVCGSQSESLSREDTGKRILSLTVRATK